MTGYISFKDELGTFYYTRKQESDQRLPGLNKKSSGANIN